MKVLKHFDILPTWSQWKKWSKPSKLTAVGVILGIVGLLIFFLFQERDEKVRPWISVPKVETYFIEGSMRTKFIIENIGELPAHIYIEGEGEKNGEPLPQTPTYKESSRGPFVLMPGQKIRFRGLYFEGDVFNALLNSQSVPKFSQSINVKYGNTRESVGEYYTYHKVSLDRDKLLKSITQEKDLGLWIFDESAIE